MVDQKFTRIVKREGGYYLFTDWNYCKMYFTGETDFFNLEFPSEKRFIKDAAGMVTGYERSYFGTKLSPAVKITNPAALNGSEEFFNTAGWTYLENKDYDEAIRYLKRGLELHPDALMIEGNLAHCYLFKNDLTAAMRIYKAHLDVVFRKGYTWKDMILQDFDHFKNNSFDKGLMDKVMHDLQL